MTFIHRESNKEVKWVKLSRQDSRRQQKPKRTERPRNRVSMWATAAGLGLYTLVASPGQFLNTGAPIPLAFTC